MYKPKAIKIYVIMADTFTPVKAYKRKEDTLFYLHKNGYIRLPNFTATFKKRDELGNLIKLYICEILYYG